MSKKCPFSDETLINARCEIKKRTEIGEDYCQGECPLNKVTVEDIIGLVKCESTNSEKKFTTKYTNHYVLEVDVYDNDERISFYEVIDLLNELHEENQNLKKENELMEKTLDNISGNLTEYRNKWVEI